MDIFDALAAELNPMLWIVFIKATKSPLDTPNIFDSVFVFKYLDD